jgi:hypothetical protein
VFDDTLNVPGSLKSVFLLLPPLQGQNRKVNRQDIFYLLIFFLGDYVETSFFLDCVALELLYEFLHDLCLALCIHTGKSIHLFEQFYLLLVFRLDIHDVVDSVPEVYEDTDHHQL